MPSDAPVEPVAAKPSGVPEITFTLGANERRLELVVPDEEGVRYVAHEIFNDRCYAPVAGLAPPRTVLDIGANVGLAAAYFRMVYPETLIHAVEPDPGAWSFLIRNEPRIGNCRLHNVGLYDRDCEKSFYSASSSVLSSLTRNPLALASSKVVTLREASCFVAELGVERFDLVKIDTEGAELPILRSLGSVIADAAVVHIEFHSRDDRRAIDDLMNPSHGLFRGKIEAAHRGHFTYVANGLLTHGPMDAPLTID